MVETRSVIRTALGDHPIGPDDDVQLVKTVKPYVGVTIATSLGVPIDPGAQLVVQQAIETGFGLLEWRDAYVQFTQPSWSVQAEWA